MVKSIRACLRAKSSSRKARVPLTNAHNCKYCSKSSLSNAAMTVTPSKKMINCPSSYLCCASKKICDRWPHQWYLSPGALLSVCQASGLVYVLTRNEPAWPSTALSCAHLLGMTTSLGLSAGSFIAAAKTTLSCPKVITSILISTGSFASLVSFTLLHPVNTWTDQILTCGIVLSTGFLLSALDTSILLPLSLKMCKSSCSDVCSKQNESDSSTSSDVTYGKGIDSDDEFNTGSCCLAIQTKAGALQLSRCLSHTIMVGCYSYQIYYLANRLRVF
ncbi:hypothetical protein GJ496_001306 [Pomphorhynchus laevis]|nr:hypothetical protein GJ496_001306 [Pomphorhynchus laevis]